MLGKNFIRLGDEESNKITGAFMHQISYGSRRWVILDGNEILKRIKKKYGSSSQIFRRIREMVLN